MNQYDMVVIGSGPAGEKAAAMAAYFGKRVAIVERESRVGGTVVSRGGIPTKTLREAASYLSGYHRRELYGVGVDIDPKLMLELLHRRAADVMDLVANSVAENIDRHGIDLVHGTATLTPDGKVAVAGDDGTTRTLEATNVLIATGSRPFRPPTVPFDDPAVDDSDSILALDSIPESLVVIGGGPVGVEYASISTALGVQVTVVDAAQRLIPFADEEISATLQAALEDDGARFVFESPGTTVERTAEGLVVGLPSGEVIAPDKVLFAAGRTGNTEGLGLDEAGVATDDRNHIVVDEHFQTSVPGIYAAGDVAGPPALASVSAEQGRIAASHAFDLGVVEQLDSLPVYGVYSIPEVGMVGQTEAAAGASGVDYAVGRYRFERNPRSRIAGPGIGMIKLVVDKRDHSLLGVHIVGEEAAELVHIGQAAIHAGDKVERFIHSTFNVPTRSEGYKFAAYDALQDISGHRLSQSD
jgi:NAD(P) transhydrogenase